MAGSLNSAESSVVGFPSSEKAVVFQTQRVTLFLVWLRFHTCVWAEDCQASLSLRFSREEDWSGLLFPTPGDLHPRIKPASPALIGRCILYH